MDADVLAEAVALVRARHAFVLATADSRLAYRSPACFSGSQYLELTKAVALPE